MWIAVTDFVIACQMTPTSVFLKSVHTAKSLLFIKNQWKAIFYSEQTIQNYNSYIHHGLGMLVCNTSFDLVLIIAHLCSSYFSQCELLPIKVSSVGNMQEYLKITINEGFCRLTFYFQLSNLTFRSLIWVQFTSGYSLANA